MDGWYELVDVEFWIVEWVRESVRPLLIRHSDSDLNAWIYIVECV